MTEDDLKKYGALFGSKLLSGASMLVKQGQLIVDHLAPSPPARWNEKFVEYHYVRRILPATAKASPLAGDAETQFGDLITGEARGDSLQLCVVEFKRSRAEIDDEYEKYLRTTAGIGSRPSTGFQQWFATANAAWLAQTVQNGHHLIHGDHPQDKAFRLLWEPYAAAGSKELHAFHELPMVDASALALYLAQLGKARAQPPENPSGGPAVLAYAKDAIARQFNKLLVNSKDGYCGTPEELLALFGHWLAIKEEADRRTAMAEAVSKRGGKPGSKRIDELLERALAVTRLLAIPAEATAATAPRYRQAGGRDIEVDPE